MTPSLETRKHLSPPPLGRLDLVEREDMKPGDLALGLCDVWHQRSEEAPRVVAARAEHARHPARVAAQESRRFGDADLRRQPHQTRRVGHACEPDVDGKLDASPANSLDPTLHRL